MMKSVYNDNIHVGWEAAAGIVWQMASALVSRGARARARRTRARGARGTGLAQRGGEGMVRM